MVEEWRTVLDSPDYEVSSLGRVGSWKRKGTSTKPLSCRRILSPHVDKGGYLRVVLVRGQSLLKRGIHRLQAEAWHGPKPYPKAVVRHLDGDPSNNVPSNLCWGTYADNSRDAREHGTWTRGERHGMAKLDENKVRYIRSSSATSTALAKELGVSRFAIYSVRIGLKWRSVL